MRRGVATALVLALAAAASPARAELVLESDLPWPDPRDSPARAITGFWGTAPDHLWAYGGGVILRWDGKRWSLMYAGHTFVTAMWGSPGDVWVRTSTTRQTSVETFGPGGPHSHVVGHQTELTTMHFDGRGWKTIEEVTCELSIGSGLRDCEARLRQRPPATPGPGQILDRAALARLWARTRPGGTGFPAVLTAGYRLPGGETWAASDSPRALLRLEGGRWRMFTSATFAHVCAVVALGRGEAMAAAVDGPAVVPEERSEAPPEDRPAILQRDRQGWYRLLSPSERVYALWAGGPEDVWAAGTGGLVRRWRQGTWELVSLGVSYQLNSIWGSDPGDVWVHGGADSLFHWQGRAWTKVPIAIDPTHRGLTLRFWGVSREDVWAVGLWSVFRWDGRKWKAVPSPVEAYAGFAGQPANRGRFIARPLVSNAIFGGITGAGPRDLWVVGTAQPSPTPEPFALHWDGERWTRATLPVTGVGLAGVWARASDDVWAVGTGGTVLRFDGKRWSRVPSPTSAHLYTVAGAGAEVWIGGAGTLMRWAPPHL
jgi:hypothetical protein